MADTRDPLQEWLDKRIDEAEDHAIQGALIAAFLKGPTGGALRKTDVPGAYEFMSADAEGTPTSMIVRANQIASWLPMVEESRIVKPDDLG